MDYLRYFSKVDNVDTSDKTRQSDIPMRYSEWKPTPRYETNLILTNWANFKKKVNSKGRQ